MLDHDYRRWRRIHALSGAVPVALFLIFHFATNAVAIAGPAAFNRLAERLDRLPFVRIVELGAIALPLLFHVVLGILLSNTAQGAGDARPYPRPAMLMWQRVTGAVLVVFVIFHVWGIRLSPDLLVKKRDLFTVTSAFLSHAGLFAFHALGVLAASIHLGLGLVGAAWNWTFPARDAARARRAGLAWAVAVAMTLVGWMALAAFVSRPARWLEGPGAAVPGSRTLPAAAIASDRVPRGGGR